VATPNIHVEILRAACCIAGIDGAVDESEIPLLKELAHKAGVGAASMNAMIDRAERDPDFYQEMFRVLKADPEQTLQSLLEVARADGAVSDDERRLLSHFAEALGMEQSRFDEIVVAE
jgi:tellurite resistance protein